MSCSLIYAKSALPNLESYFYSKEKHEFRGIEPSCLSYNADSQIALFADYDVHFINKCDATFVGRRLLKNLLKVTNLLFNSKLSATREKYFLHLHTPVLFICFSLLTKLSLHQTVVPNRFPFPKISSRFTGTFLLQNGDFTFLKIHQWTSLSLHVFPLYL